VLDKTGSDVEEFWEVDTLAEVVTAVKDILVVAGEEVAPLITII